MHHVLIAINMHALNYNLLDYIIYHASHADNILFIKSILIDHVLLPR